MDVEGISISFSDVDKYLADLDSNGLHSLAPSDSPTPSPSPSHAPPLTAIATKSAESSVRAFVQFLQKCQKKVSGGKVSQELNYAIRKLVNKLMDLGPRPLYILALSEIITCFAVITMSWILDLLSSLQMGPTSGSRGGGPSRGGALDSAPFGNSKMIAILILVTTTKAGKVKDLIQKGKSLDQIGTIAKYFSEAIAPKTEKPDTRTSKQEGIKKAAKQEGLSTSKQEGIKKVAFEGMRQLIEQVGPENKSIFIAHVLPSIMQVAKPVWNSSAIHLVLLATDFVEKLDIKKAQANIKDNRFVSPANAAIFVDAFSSSDAIPEPDSELWGLIKEHVSKLTLQSEKESFVKPVWLRISSSLVNSKQDAKLFDLLFNWAAHDPILTATLIVGSQGRVFDALRRQASSNPAVSTQLADLCMASPSAHTICTCILSQFPDFASSLPLSVVAPISTALVSHFFSPSPLFPSVPSISVPSILFQVARQKVNMKESLTPELIQWNVEVLKFLFFHAFFSVAEGGVNAVSKKGGMSALGHSIVGTIPDNLDSARQDIQDYFFRLLVHTSSLLSAKSSKGNDEGKEKGGNADGEGKGHTRPSSLYSDIVHFHHELLSIKEVKFEVKMEAGDVTEKERLETLEASYNIIHAISLHQNKNPDNTKHLDAFQLLHCITYLNALVDPLEPIDNLTDLQHCYKDMSPFLLASKEKKDKDKNESRNKGKYDKGLAVLVDIVISLQTKAIRIVGALPEYIIRVFAQQLTREMVDQILSAITQNSLESIGIEEEEEEAKESGEETENTEENETEDQEMEENEDDEEDIMLDDLDDAAWEELDQLAATALKNTQKHPLVGNLGKRSKASQPTSKDPNIAFKERVASLLYTYVKKTKSPTLFELIPSFLNAISSLHSDLGEDENATKGRGVNNALHSVSERISKIVENICRLKAHMAQELPAIKISGLVEQLSPLLSNKDVIVSSLAADALITLVNNNRNKDTTNFGELLNSALKNSAKDSSKYTLRALCTRMPDLVWSNPNLLSTVVDKQPKLAQALLSNMDLPHLKKAGVALEQILKTHLGAFKGQAQAKAKAFPPVLGILHALRTLTQRMVTLSSREVVKESLPGVAHMLNNIAQNEAVPASSRKLARRITSTVILGSQKQSKKQLKTKRKINEAPQEKVKDKDEDKGDDKEAENKKLYSKPNLYYTKSHAYQTARKRGNEEEEVKASPLQGAKRSPGGGNRGGKSNRGNLAKRRKI